ncbi:MULTISPECIES: Gfo/Idh/MocA family oxidoreductase [Thalassospira]|uniref:Oxidoreductase n=2 Tax=Thalassospira tepidiphila TaxID=393657 RepID=A0A853L6E1_9PROT|nr:MULTISPECIES: Gfo/Idh/MocA family oxidoreductase [Thalassospira]MBE72373.1 gfo/Idh/MocA family oxidoreductase [Thalassospira sp.]NJB73927.1 UDP-N-acetyl-2-amino-2-deoxyglucuronate dehydrogenase [Thalassospira tepidiphila]OAZ11913.1 oxidoreductase [Thalassospira tepidiphila MCCC 1A03514]QPO11185.1 Gfo/Idh/MocA family oxidoreductase [Thalassospira sp. A40-3]|tara:strand:- start:1753 stop:2694 length:942 start_codon:yes stop_codon:yes gene_type:complete
MNKFALIGAAGYIAPRHMRAIKEVQGELVAAFDPADSVGAMDSYFPDASFFTEFERFDRHIDVLSRSGNGVDYMCVCSPNYLHDAHSRFGLRSGADVICEKPLVLNPWNLDGLQEMEQHTGRTLYTILQLRLHPAIMALKQRIDAAPIDKIFEVDLTYITSRGAWYYVSWKGNEAKSGGIATNIGVHFYDMLSFVFGELQCNNVHVREPSHAAGYLEFKRARVRWFLSVDRNDLPTQTPDGQTTYRSITVDGDEVEFSGGFTDLHTRSYQDILNGGGFGIDQVRPSIELVSSIRSKALEPQKGDMHSFVIERN